MLPMLSDIGTPVNAERCCFDQSQLAVKFVSGGAASFICQIRVKGACSSAAAVYIYQLMLFFLSHFIMNQALVSIKAKANWAISSHKVMSEHIAVGARQHE